MAMSMSTNFDVVFISRGCITMCWVNSLQIAFTSALESGASLTSGLVLYGPYKLPDTWEHEHLMGYGCATCASLIPGPFCILLGLSGDIFEIVGQGGKLGD
ncbi:hypothetical protein L208DRAFT_355692 [Tricholoma matsutake]|nr:hypothetical protein L208DRAFT_355692 [Tricholoma matsutake 945]